MAKRKRDNADSAGAAKGLKSRKAVVITTPKQTPQRAAPIPATVTAKDGSIEASTTTTTFQIITGSYEKVLHGFTAAIPKNLVTGSEHVSNSNGKEEEKDAPKIAFSDTFLFAAHTSSIRCLAISPVSDDSSKVTLATGSTDERINLYTLSTAPSQPSKLKPQLPSLNSASIAENSANKELGSLLHHTSSITALYFPTRSKLLSSAEDSTIAITRTRDWTPLSVIKAPIPKAQGRPSGDTAAPGEVPAGINDFAVHPSMKLMVSVGKGEKNMRLWNLVTGKKAGVLNFGRDILSGVGEGRFGTGEGRKVVWDTAGEEFAVGFERGAVVFGIDCKPKAKLLPAPRTKLHQMQYLPSETYPGTLLVSTEDGRIMLYDTTSTTEAPAPPTTETSNPKDKEEAIPSSTLMAQIGGPAAGITTRVKDFSIHALTPKHPSLFLIVTGSSDGTVRLWTVDMQDLAAKTTPKTDPAAAAAAAADDEAKNDFTAKRIGKLIGTYSTGTRITCLESFEMTGKVVEGAEEEQAVENIVVESSSGSEEEDSE
ncbi:60S ribosome biogenesis protein Mak11 [Pleomassaria siparia CBS 279.74]|uniref:60S ribosome biogenesis protein Mak11 n=1 Tax=Pleomassaria siparia CBS 279.74 TaxID=1314801 RepID=A0A6G1JQP6_9PLEO|nr:60S ribosome biogenesis protein Mak11 [Pleomassaria siparia CBS 279.74]